MRREFEIPLDGETVATIMAAGDLDHLMVRLSKEQFWDVIQKSVPGYPRRIFNAAWTAFKNRNRSKA